MFKIAGGSFAVAAFTSDQHALAGPAVMFMLGAYASDYVGAELDAANEARKRSAPEATHHVRVDLDAEREVFAAEPCVDELEAKRHHDEKVSHADR